MLNMDTETPYNISTNKKPSCCIQCNNSVNSFHSFTRSDFDL